MNVHLFSFSKKKNSTKLPTGTGAVVDVALKNPCSLLNPTLILGIENSEYNYMYLYDTERGINRYYFLAEPATILDANRCEMSFTEDILATWKNQISTRSAYIARTSDTSQVNDMITDGLYPAQNTINTSMVDDVDIGITRAIGVYCVGLVCSALSSPISKRGSVQYVLMTSAQITTLVDSLITNWSPTQKAFDYIVSCVYIPFHISNLVTITDTGRKFMGDSNSYSVVYSSYDNQYDTDMSIYEVYDNTYSIRTYPSTLSHGNYMNYAPWLHLKMYSGIFGNAEIPLDYFSSVASSRKMGIKVSMDLPTGQAHLQLYNGSSSNGRQIWDTFGQVGIPILLAKQSYLNEANVTGLISGTVGMVAGIATANPLMAIAGGSSAIASVLDSWKPKTETKGSNGTHISIADEDIHFVYEYYTPVEHSIDDFGAPCMKSMTIQTIASGSYIKCEHIHADFACTDYERAQIESICENGFYYE